MDAKFFIFLVLFTCEILKTNSKVDRDDGKGSLVFVFDTTGSMYNDLRQLREGAEMILKTALEESHVIADFVFVPFHDPGVGPATVTKDKEVFKKALASVGRVYGGGNCPEMTLTGIQLALNASRPRSFLYVFTDASAYDHKLVGKVLDAVQRKQSQVVFVLTGHCNDLDKPTYRVYHQIATASSGQVFNLNKTSVYKVLDFVRSSIKDRSVNLASVVNPPGYNYTQEVPVDGSLREVTVSVAGARPRVRVLSPRGEELRPPRLLTTLDLSEIMIVKVLKPEPGNWSISVGSEEQHSVRVVGLSELTFRQGFSVQPPTDMDDTSYRPLKGTYNHMLISVSGADRPLHMEHAQLLSMDGKLLFETPLKELDKERNIFQADAFIPPDDFFNIAIIGRDENGHEIRRIGSTAVQAKPPDAPYLVVTKKIEARAHTQVKLTCRAESLVPVSVAWTRDGVQLPANTHALQSTSIEYVIEHMSEGYVGTYWCVATNAAGSSRASTVLDMIVEPPQVTVSPANATLTLSQHDALTLSCSVLSETLLKRTQIVFNGTNNTYVTDVNLEPSVDGYYTFNHTIQDVSDRDTGTYTCVAANRGGTTNQSSYILVKPKPTAKIMGEQTITKHINSDFQLICNVQNAEKARWLDINNNIVKKYEVNGSVPAVLDIRNITEDGVWTCLAIQNFLNASDTVNVTVLIKPRVTIDGPKNITIVNGTRTEITCEVLGKPAPVITWRMEQEQDLPYIVTNTNPNIYKSVLTLDSKKGPVNGTYFCTAQNSEGTDTDTITVRVRRKMTLLQGFSDISVELYSQIDFHCSVDSDPLPNITWYHNGTTLDTDNINISDDSTIINIQKIDFNDLGLYVCEADNGYEKMAVNGTLSVHGLEKPTLLKETIKISAQEGKSALITCRVLKGNPEPNIIWQYRPKTSKNFTTLPKNVEIDEDSGVNIERVVKENAGVYKCTADNVIGGDTYEVDLVVQYPPEFNVSQESHSELEGPKQVKVGEKLKFTCNVTGIPPPIITWTKDESPVIYSRKIYLEEDNSLVVENVTKFDSGVFTCNASSALGFVLKNFSITVYKTPEIVKSGIPEIEVIEGQLVELPCSAQGVPTPRLQWLQNGQVITEARKYIDEYGLRFVANLTDFGEYTCLASNDYGNSSVNYTVLIWVSPSIESPLEIFEDVQAGGNVSIKCNAVGFPIPTITWAFRDHILDYNTTDLNFNEYGNLNITHARAKNEGPYDCIAENLAGTAKKTFYINVKEAPRILEDNYTMPYVALNLDTALIVSCKAVGNPKPYVAWIKDGFYLDSDSRYDVGLDGSLTIKNPTEDLSGTYTCVARNSAGNATKHIPVKIYSVPVLMQDEGAPAVITAVEGADAILQCPVHGNDYNVKWYKDTELIANGTLNFSNVSRANESTYTCVASNAAGSVHSNIALQVQWPPSFITNSSGNIEVIEGNDYYLDCKTDAKPRAQTKWLFNSKLLLGKDKDTLKLLNVNIRHSGKYKCISTNERGVRQKQFNLSVLEPPFISEFEMLDVQLKAGANATLECNARGTPIPTITWTFNNTNWMTQNSSLISKNISSQSEGTYRCEARSKAGVAHLVYRVAVVSAARIEGVVMYKDGVGTDVEKSLDLLLNTNVRLACKASGNPQPIIQWIRHGDTLSENTDGVNYADLMLRNISASQAGLYSCIASNEGGTEERNVKVNVLEPPRIFQTLFQNANASQNIIEMEVISGQAFYLHCHPYGNPLPEIYWFKDGLPLKLYDDTMLSKDFGEILVSKSAKHEQSGNYTCVARNKVGDTGVVYLIDVLVPPPQHKETVKRVNTLRGDALNLTCAARGRPAPSVLWVKHPYTEVVESQRVHLLNDNYTLLIPDSEVADSGKYSCIMSNKVGTTELVYDVTIETPPSIAGNVGNDTSEDHVVALRRSVVLKCEVEGHPQPKITWFKDIQQLSDSQPNVQRVLGSSLVGLWSVGVGDAGQYICVAENAVGTAHRRYNVAVLVPGKWSAWSEWSYCNATCGAGVQQRARSCQYLGDNNRTIDRNSQPDKLILDESECKGPSKARRACNMPPCEEEESSKWSSWSKWSRCSVSCGAGTQARGRRCGGRAPCKGDNVQIRKCPGLPTCRVNRRQSEELPEVSGETEPEYIPEATIEMPSESPETLHEKKFTDIDEDFYIPSEIMRSFYKVIPTENLDGSDRGQCGAGYTHNVENNTCEDINECVLDNNRCHATQLCSDAPGAYICSCPEGYASLGAGQRCMDVNECTQDTHGCEFACVNVAGGYVCACPAHLRLHADRHRCVAPSMYRKSSSYEDLEREDYLGTSFEYTSKYPKRTKY